MVESPSNINIWEASAPGNNKTVHFMVNGPWRWVMEDLAANLSMKAVDAETDLPSAQRPPALVAASPGMDRSSHRRARRNRQTRQRVHQGRASLRIEVVDNNDASDQLLLAAHGISACLDGLGDKDELVRTFQRCRCENANLAPPSLLIQWDVSEEECRNIIGHDLPRLKGSDPESSVAVLKEPMGSRGQGIYFIRTAAEIHKIIDEHHQHASQEPEVLEKLIAAKGRIPSWVLQAEVAPALLIRNRRKFHIRSYVVVVERTDDEVLDMLVYGRHEVRVAGVSVSESEGQNRNPLSHITNGALSKASERLLLTELPELVGLGMPEKLELFISEVFGKHLLSDISRRIPPPGAHSSPVREFAVAGLDIMVTEQLDLYLLEVNVNPSAPPQEMCSESYASHLRGFFQDLVNLVTMGVSAGGDFRDVFAILERHASERSD